MADYDVIVVGAGLTGSFAARSLAATGRAVLVLEARERGHADGSSHGSSRIFRSAHPDPLWAEMSAQALRGWRELDDDPQAPLLTLTGGLDFGIDREPEKLFEAVRANGVDCELLEPEEAHERYPGLTFPTRVVHHELAGWLDPERAMDRALAAAAGHGAEIRFQTPVRRITRMNGSFSVDTESTTDTSRHVVVAAGPWLPGLLDGAVGERPLPRLDVTEQNVFHFPLRSPEASWPVLVCKHENQFFGLPSGRDSGGVPALKIGRHDRGPIADPDSRAKSIDPTTRALVTSFAEVCVPGIDPTPLREDACLYTRTANDDFVLDDVDGLIIASPCSGQGAKFAPAIGEEISDLVTKARTARERFLTGAHS